MLGIVSDIHGNLEAFEAVLVEGFRRGVDRWYCLGDVVGYGADPNECVDLARECCAVTLLGNHDEMAVESADASTFNSLAAEAIAWTRRTLTDASRSFLTGLPYRHEEGAATFVHAAPNDPGGWGYIDDEIAARKNAAGFSTRVCFTGHSHCPAVFDVSAENAPAKRRIVNVGSVGQPRDGDPRACLVLMDEQGDEDDAEFVRVEYEIDRAQSKIVGAGLPGGLAMRLALGM